MKPFIHDDFLLNNDVSHKLFHNYVKDLPIIDFHCHLDPKEIYEDKQFRNLFDAWLTGDHYKWRLIRANGIDESFITGDQDDFDKFMKWAGVVEELIGNPLYHWTHFELKRFFGIDELLSSSTAATIYDNVNEQLKTLTARKLISMSNVEVICTTDDPVDDLKWHKLLKEDNTFDTRVLPTFRPDKAINIDQYTFSPWIQKLEEVVGFKISTLDELEKALLKRVEFFAEVGCNISDHALDEVTYRSGSKEEVNNIFVKVIRGGMLDKVQIEKYKGYILVYLSKLYCDFDWTQQYHIGALRNVNTRMYSQLGPDTGYDAINDSKIAKPLSRLLDAQEQKDHLPKTIIYTLNPSDFETAITIMQAFQKGTPGKIQFGSAWWFLDTIDGMEKQIKALANNGVLSRFVGMLTDSRSFLSYPRHEYFRRLLCNFVGEQVEQGLFPENYEVLSRIVKNIAYYNSKNYFKY